MLGSKERSTFGLKVLSWETLCNITERGWDLESEVSKWDKFLDQPFTLWTSLSSYHLIWVSNELKDKENSPSHPSHTEKHCTDVSVTETAVTKMTNDILIICLNGLFSVLNLPISWQNLNWLIMSSFVKLFISMIFSSFVSRKLTSAMQFSLWTLFVPLTATCL